MLTQNISSRTQAGSAMRVVQITGCKKSKTGDVIFFGKPAHMERILSPEKEANDDKPPTLEELRSCQLLIE